MRREKHERRNARKESRIEVELIKLAFLNDIISDDA